MGCEVLGKHLGVCWVGHALVINTPVSYMKLYVHLQEFTTDLEAGRLEACGL